MSGEAKVAEANAATRHQHNERDLGPTGLQDLAKSIEGKYHELAEQIVALEIDLSADYLHPSIMPAASAPRTTGESAMHRLRELERGIVLTTAYVKALRSRVGH